jgi:hypothetical protein
MRYAKIFLVIFALAMTACSCTWAQAPRVPGSPLRNPRKIALAERISAQRSESARLKIFNC